MLIIAHYLEYYNKNMISLSKVGDSMHKHKYFYDKNPSAQYYKEYDVYMDMIIISVSKKRMNFKILGKK